MNFKHFGPLIVAGVSCGLLVEPFYHNNEEKQKYSHKIPLVEALNPEVNNTFEHTHTNYPTEHIGTLFSQAVSTSGSISSYPFIYKIISQD
jgi:hypothetical protein